MKNAAILGLSFILFACAESTPPAEEAGEAAAQEGAEEKVSAPTSVAVPVTPDADITGADIGIADASSSGHKSDYSEARAPCNHYTEHRLPLFGDVHVHTNLSFDAAANTIGATPEDANKFARGEAIPFWPLDKEGRPVGEFQIDRPLDFLAVTDHGEFLGERRMCHDPESPNYGVPFCEQARESERQGMLLLGQVITSDDPVRISEICGDDGSACLEMAKEPWQRMAADAEAAYDKSERCEFSSFVAYEYTGTPSTSNYHRNVIFRNGNVPDLPVSYIDAPYDSLLWEKLDAACQLEQGCDYLTIPHNSNLANGRMAPYMRLEATEDNRRAYAATRLKREPIMEIFQHKGGSECINGLSSVLGEPDELCDVEAVRFIGREESYATRTMVDGRLEQGVATQVTEECQPDEIDGNGMLGAGCVHATDYLRSGLLVGLEEENEIGLNPVKLGVIAASDTHTATPGAVKEDDWRGHVSVEATPEERLQPGLLTSGIDGNPGGLAGVWAKENSRDEIFNAMLRREVFGTSGPRIVPRFFAGWRYADNLCDSETWVEAGYAQGVPMGGDLTAPPSEDAKPVFIASAMRDSADDATPLQQLQLIKGWIDSDGQKRTRVMTIAGSPNSVSESDAEEPVAGQDSFCVVYRDESFSADQSAYYYLRAVELPTARWSVYDCQALPEDRRPAVCEDGSYPTTVQEMAWTSPIWFQAGQ